VKNVAGSPLGGGRSFSEALSAAGATLATRSRTIAGPLALGRVGRPKDAQRA
jgi:hypothetical protein